MRISLLLLLPLLLFGLEGKVRLELASQPPYLVSERLTFRMQVMTTGFSVTRVRADFGGNDSNFVIIAPDSAAYVQSVEDENGTWQSAVYEYALYPLKIGNLTLRPVRVRFEASQGYGQPTAKFNLETAPIPLHIDSVKGAHGFVLSTPKLTLQVRYKPVPETLNVGDAFERTVTLRAENVPDLLLPSLFLPDNPYFRIYRDEPKLKTDGTTAERIEHETYVAIKEGNASLPAQRLQWYDPVTDTLNTETLPAWRVEIRSPVQTESAELDSARFPAYFFEIFSLLITLGVLGGTFVYRQYNKRERRAYRALKKACRCGDAVAIYNAYYRWRSLTGFTEKIDITTLANAAAKQLSYDCSPLLQAINEAHKTSAAREKSLPLRINPRSA